MREQRITSYNYVGAGYSYTDQRFTEPLEKRVQLLAVIIVEYGEPWEWCSLMPVVRRWDTPNASTPNAKLGLFFFGILH
jgi:hypothetical protein